MEIYWKTFSIKIEVGIDDYTQNYNNKRLEYNISIVFNFLSLFNFFQLSWYLYLWLWNQHLARAEVIICKEVYLLQFSKYK